MLIFELDTKVIRSDCNGCRFNISRQFVDENTDTLLFSRVQSFEVQMQSFVAKDGFLLFINSLVDVNAKFICLF